MKLKAVLADGRRFGSGHHSRTYAGRRIPFIYRVTGRPPAVTALQPLPHRAVNLNAVEAAVNLL